MEIFMPTPANLECGDWNCNQHNPTAVAAIQQLYCQALNNVHPTPAELGESELQFAFTCKLLLPRAKLSFYKYVRAKCN